MTQVELEDSVTRYALSTYDVSRDIIQEIELSSTEKSWPGFPQFDCGPQSFPDHANDRCLSREIAQKAEAYKDLPLVNHE